MYIRRISIFKKPADKPYLGGFRGEKSRDANGFSTWPHLTLTGPLVKIGGLSDILESYLYRYDIMFYRFCNLSVTPLRLKIISKLFLGHFFIFLLAWYHTEISFYHYFLLNQYYTIREDVRGRGLIIGRLRTGRGRRRPRMAFLYISRTSEYQERYEDVRGRQGSKITRVQDKDVRGRRRPRLGLVLGRGRR